MTAALLGEPTKIERKRSDVKARVLPLLRDKIFHVTSARSVAAIRAVQQAEWANLWQQCLRINYRPVVDIRVVKLTLPSDSQRVNKPPKNMWVAVAEILKYAVKPSDMVRDHDWFLTLTDQLHKTRAVAMGGIIKRYIKEQTRENLKSEPGEEPAEDVKEQLYFGCKQEVRRTGRMCRYVRGEGEMFVWNVKEHCGLFTVKQIVRDIVGDLFLRTSLWIGRDGSALGLGSFLSASVSTLQRRTIRVQRKEGGS